MRGYPSLRVHRDRTAGTSVWIKLTIGQGSEEMTWVEGRAATIDRPLDDVWNFMLDISNMPRWEDSGAEWNALFNIRVTAFEPKRTFTVEALDGFGRGTKISYVLEPIEARRTRLRRVTEVELHGVASLLRPFSALIVRKTASIEANNVKRLVEGQTQ